MGKHYLFILNLFVYFHYFLLLAFQHKQCLSKLLPIMDDVIKDWKKLSLTDTEGTKINLSKSKNLFKREHVLAAKFMTRRALNVEAIGRTFKPLWRARNDFQIREAGDHILLFVFELETDAERVIATEPWSFDKHLVIFSRYDFSIPTRNLRFTTTTFWVQIHGLPMNMLDPETAVEIGETIGTVSRTKHSNDMVGGDFLRVRVVVDVTKPLCRGWRIAINNTCCLGCFQIRETTKLLLLVWKGVSLK